MTGNNPSEAACRRLFHVRIHEYLSCTQSAIQAHLWVVIPIYRDGDTPPDFHAVSSSQVHRVQLNRCRLDESFACPEAFNSRQTICNIWTVAKKDRCHWRTFQVRIFHVFEACNTFSARVSALVGAHQIGMSTYPGKTATHRQTVGPLRNPDDYSAQIRALPL
ncbi:hypothetical protein PAXRUDRAFT_657091 [Paxillus rubicundulus Ve08.2h10]|uniref:Unplaced genomic scaffold scaffold_63, whole genome shotgun sequence n=1 Tax=Paxillus rubicundulus Ve08.2h10 TaxID=930991 RepID=A0A0D0EC31_9AGAM|nr:hypothetical protein PAXRUDRAFT_657091 [Paxillus rubicundulus Ve08.2h10]